MRKYLSLALFGLLLLSPITLVPHNSFAQSDEETTDTSDPTGETDGEIIIYN